MNMSLRIKFMEIELYLRRGMLRAEELEEWEVVLQNVEAAFKDAVDKIYPPEGVKVEAKEAAD
jgi:hypothetical protein